MHDGRERPDTPGKGRGRYGGTVPGDPVRPSGFEPVNRDMAFDHSRKTTDWRNSEAAAGAITFQRM